MTIRTRIAPSPTGAPHIGTAYIALFNYAFAKSNNGQFVLRIEDTDRARSTSESETAIIDALRWLEIPWDEGPDVGGPHGPYRQSERSDIYRDHCMKLVDEGKAYPCFCTPERLAELRREQQASKQDKQGYDGLCSRISREDAREKMESGVPYVIRLLVPEAGECVFKDRFREEVRIPWNTIDHQVLLKTDGFPTYHLANVVDDHLMEISHVIRGEEWISSTPKHLMLYEAFGWTPPEFAHLPLLRNPDKSKLSKRKNPTSILYYRQAGFLPEAVVNYLGLMAYSMPDGNERFNLEQLVASFDFNRVSLGGPVFDLAKLRSFNSDYIRSLSPDRLLERLTSWMLNEGTWKKIVPMAQPRLNQLSDMVPMTAYLFGDRLEYDVSLLHGGEDADDIARLLKLAQWQLERTREWDKDSIYSVFKTMSEKEDIKLKKLMMPFFVAVSGSAVALPVFESMEVIGRDMTLRRIQYALDELDAAGFPLKGKKLKKLTSYHESTYEADGTT